VEEEEKDRRKRFGSYAHTLDFKMLKYSWTETSVRGYHGIHG
jgi:hypothetical protein